MAAIRKIHRYFALVLGLAFLAWLVSGILMVIGEPSVRALQTPPAYTYNFAAVTLSPADVVRRAQLRLGAAAEVQRIMLRPLRDQLVYEVHAPGQPAMLFNPQTGDPVEVTPAMAELIVRDRLKPDAGEAHVERLDRHSTTYPWGVLPAYRLEFENEAGTFAHVAVADGAVSFTDWRKRIWHLFVGFHTFDPITIVFGSDRLRNRVLLVSGVLSLVIVATGYYMEYVTLWRRKKKRAADS